MNNLDEYLVYLQEIEPVTATALTGVAAYKTAALMGASAMSVFMGATRLYKDYFTKAAKRCANLPAKEKGICIMKAKLIAKNAQLQKLKSGLATCQKGKKPDKCKQKFLEKIKKLYEEIKFMANRMKELRSQPYDAGASK